MYWIGWPARWELAFDSWFWPLLGFLIAPWTTLAWALCAPGGIEGFDYFLIGMSIFVDLTDARRQRRVLPATVHRAGADARRY